MEFMKVAGLFAGIGGFELGLADAGHHAALLCDILPTSQAVLKHRFPKSEIVADVVGPRDAVSDLLDHLWGRQGVLHGVKRAA